MFQYAQSMLEALAGLAPEAYAVTIAYSDEEWSGVLNRLGLTGHVLQHARTGQRISDGAMALRLPAKLMQVVGGLLNPLVKELQSLQCDAWIFPAQESLSYQLAVPSIGTIHDLMHRYEPGFPEVSAKFRYGIREHRFGNIARRCHAVLVDSETGRNQVIESYGVDGETVFSLPYVAPSYLQNSEERPDFEAHYQLPEKFIFYPAQFWPHKNHQRLLDALQIVSRTHSDIALVLSGRKQHSFEAIHQHAESLGLTSHVKFVGYVPDADLRGFYTRARALVMPTFFGPTNIPPLEALATGCPALVSDIYGMREQSGDAALYFDPRSTKDMAEKIATVWQDDALAQSMAEKGFQRTRSRGQAAFNQRLAHILDKVFESISTSIHPAQ
jgi:glycosyltransferase involved in cell wall biosynthesis